MITSQYRQYIVEQKAKNDTLIFKVWEPIKQGHFYREIKTFNGILYGRKGTRYPYIKKTKKMDDTEHIAYKQYLDEKEQTHAYEIIEICHPDIFTKKFLLVEGEALVLIP